LFVFQRLMFLYQLVNLVLETCFIFSKALKLSKTFCLEFLVLFDHSNNERYDSPIPDFGTKMFKKMWILECLGVFLQSQLWCRSWILAHLFSEGCLNDWLVNENHNSEFRVLCSLIHNWITRWAPCSLTYSQIHGHIKTGRFFENPLVGRHVERLKIVIMAQGKIPRKLGAM
jgi:hypothetical protein